MKDNQPHVLITKSGEIIKVRSEHVDYVKSKLKESNGVINRKNGDPIRVYDVVSFTPEQPKTDLAEEAAKAFHEPMIKEESVICKWVKQEVAAAKYASWYSKSPGYRLLYGNGSYMTVAFRLPVHVIDKDRVSECTSQEIEQLTKHS